MIQIPEDQNERIRELSRLVDTIRKFDLKTVALLKDFKIAHGNFYRLLEGDMHVSSYVYVKAYILNKSLNDHFKEEV